MASWVTKFSVEYPTVDMAFPLLAAPQDCDIEEIYVEAGDNSLLLDVERRLRGALFDAGSSVLNDDLLADAAGYTETEFGDASLGDKEELWAVIRAIDGESRLLTGSVTLNY